MLAAVVRGVERQSPSKAGELKKLFYQQILIAPKVIWFMIALYIRKDK